MRLVWVVVAAIILILGLASCSNRSMHEDSYPVMPSAVPENDISIASPEYPLPGFPNAPNASENTSENTSPTIQSESSLNDSSNTSQTTEPPFSPDFIVVEGVVLDFIGTVYADGTVPPYMDWFHIDIRKDCGTEAVVIGLYRTAFFLDGMLQPGMDIHAYVFDEMPVFTASIRRSLADGVFDAFGVFDASEVSDAFEVFDVSEVSDTAEVLDMPEIFGVTEVTNVLEGLEHIMGERPVYIAAAVVSGLLDDDTENEAVAAELAALSSWELAWWIGLEDTPNIVELTVFDHVYSIADFEIVDLPVYVNGERIHSPPPLRFTGGVDSMDNAAEDALIMVAFRSIFMSGVGFGNYSGINLDGGLNFGGGGAGSENAHWTLGDAWIAGMGWRGVLHTAPIIVDGVIYVEVFSSLGWGAPGVGAWVFDDRVYIYNNEATPYGTWLGRLEAFDVALGRHVSMISAEDIAALTIVVNGTIVDVPPPVLLDDLGGLQIMIPLIPIVEAMGYRAVRSDDELIDIYKMIGESTQIVTSVGYMLIDDEIYAPLRWLGWSGGLGNQRVWLHQIIGDDQILIASVSPDF